MPFPFAIPWYAICTEAVDALWLSSVILAHAAGIIEAVRALEEVRRAEDPPELLRFEVDDAPATADGADACDYESVDSSAPLSDLLASGARRVFGVSSLRPRQEAARPPVAAALAARLARTRRAASAAARPPPAAASAARSARARRTVAGGAGDAVLVFVLPRRCEAGGGATARGRGSRRGRGSARAKEATAIARWAG